MYRLEAPSRRRGARRARAGILAMMAALAVVATACGSGDGDGDSDAPEGGGRGGTLTIATNVTPYNLNPGIAGAGALATYIHPAYESLLQLQPDGTLEPGLATEWGFTDEANQVFEVTIREGVKFSDGTDMTAEAVASSIDYWRGAGGAFGHFLADATIEATGEDTVTITQAQPFPDLPYMFSQSYLAGAIIAPAAIANPDIMGTETIGAGPYVLDTEATVANSSYVYVPNPHYYDESKIYWEQLVINVFADSNSGLQALQTGQIQLMLGDSSVAATAAGNPDLQVLTSPVNWTGMWILDWNGKNTPALGDIRVRQALNYALDRESIIPAIFGEYGEPSSNIRGPGSVGYDEAYDGRFEYDPDEARSLLAEAGYADGFTLNITLNNTPSSIAMAQVIDEQLSEVGITVETKSNTTTAQLGADIFSGNYGAWVWTPSIASPAIAYQSTIHQVPWAGPPTDAAGQEMEALYASAASMPQDEAEEAWADVFRAVIDGGYLVSLGRVDQIFLASNSIEVSAPGQTIHIDPITIRPAS